MTAITLFKKIGDERRGGEGNEQAHSFAWLHQVQTYTSNEQTREVPSFIGNRVFSVIKLLPDILLSSTTAHRK